MRILSKAIHASKFSIDYCIIFQGSRFLTFEEFRSKFKINTNFLNYLGLCHAVPQKWINILKGNVTEPLEKRSEKDKISLDKLSCRSATKFFVKSKFVTPTAERRMKEASLREHTIQLIYSLPFNVTKDTRLAIFQYKIIQHFLEIQWRNMINVTSV